MHWNTANYTKTHEKDTQTDTKKGRQTYSLKDMQTDRQTDSLKDMQKGENTIRHKKTHINETRNWNHDEVTHKIKMVHRQETESLNKDMKNN